MMSIDTVVYPTRTSFIDIRQLPGVEELKHHSEDQIHYDLVIRTEAQEYGMGVRIFLSRAQLEKMRSQLNTLIAAGEYRAKAGVTG
jgi:hypothetical protein